MEQKIVPMLRCSENIEKDDRNQSLIQISGNMYRFRRSSDKTKFVSFLLSDRSRIEKLPTGKSTSRKDKSEKTRTGQTPSTNGKRKLLTNETTI